MPPSASPAAALEVLPELADVARLRGRALLSPLLDKLIDGGAVGKADFEGAYEAYRLAAIMNPDDSAEADEALGRIRDLCQKLEARDKDDLDEVIETTGKAVEEKSLRFGRARASFVIRVAIPRSHGRPARWWHSTTARKAGRLARSCPTRCDSTTVH